MKRVLFPFGPILLIVVALGAGWYLKFIHFGPTKEAPFKPAQVAYVLPERVVNLADKNGSRYLKIGVTLEFKDPTHKEGQLIGDALKQQEDALGQQLLPYQPAIDDFMITTLARQSSSELLTPEGKETLREELLKGLRARVPTPILDGVYFTEFIIQ